MHTNPLQRLLLALFCAGNIASAQAQSASELGLADALAAALARGDQTATAADSPRYQSSQWLAALPSVAFSYLKSNENDGVDETVIGLNLPLKSPSLRRVDRQLKALQTEIATSGDVQRRLLYSGLIRETVWAHRLVRSRLAFTREKQQLLVGLEQQYAALVAANASARFGLLLVQQELLALRVSALEQEQELRRWRGQFRQITGMGMLPGQIVEEPPDTAVFQPYQHPQVRLLEQRWQQQELMLAANGSASEPWNLAIIAKNQDSNAFEEDQFGMALEVPLGFMEIDSQSRNNEWLSAVRDYHLQRDALQIELQSQWDALGTRADMLDEKLRLQQQSIELSRQITEQINALHASSELEQQVLLRHLMANIDAKAAAALTQTLIYQNIAMQRQAAGLSL
jgi:hypothetical protein